MTSPNADGGDAAAWSPEQWAHVRPLIEQTLDLPSESRSAFLDSACAGDDALRHRIERLVAACEHPGDTWGFLAQPAGRLAAPMLVGDEHVMAELMADGAPAAFRAAIADRYVVGAELGRGGMATVYLAKDLRHHRDVAMKVLDRDLGALLGAERFLSEIRVTASLQHPNLLPLFDSGEAGGLLYYVMPLVNGATLRARLQRDRQLPVDEALGLVRVIAMALDYAHRQGVVHRDLKPENILLQDGQPLVADFGISVAVSRAADARPTRPGISLGTPQYMSPEQASGGTTIDGRSDIYSLASVLYELLVGAPPFVGDSIQTVITKVLTESPASVRSLRPGIPAHVDAAINRALAKLPADRFATARAFGEALAQAPVVFPSRSHAGWRRAPARLLLGVAVTVGLAASAWVAFGTPAAPPEVTTIRYRNLVDQRILSAVTITPNGRSLVYTGSGEAGAPLMVQPLDQLAGRALPGTEGAIAPVVAHDGRRVAFVRDGDFATVSLDGVSGGNAAKAWRYGGPGWISDSAIVIVGGPTRGLKRIRIPDTDTGTTLTIPDVSRGESRHGAPLVLPDARAVVFTINLHGGPGSFSGPLAIAALEPSGVPSPHVRLGVEARRAIALVDGWLLFVSADGRAIMAARLDVARQQIRGAPVSVLTDSAGHLETGTLADNGSLLYVKRPRINSPVLVDSTGIARPLMPGVSGSFMNPRVSPDGKHLALQATAPRGGYNVLLYDIATRTPTQLTTTGNALHPTWTPDGSGIVFMRAGRLGLMSQPVDGSAAAQAVPGTTDAFAPMVVSPDGKSIVFQQQRPGTPWSVWSAPYGGDGASHTVLSDGVSHYMPAASPDGRWLADVSNATGRNEVYARPFPGPGPAVQVSDSGGTEPAWSRDGHRIYYRTRSAFVEAVVVNRPALVVTSRRELFKDAFDGAMPHRNYDVAPDGSGFIMITGGSSEAVIVEHWLTRLRERLARER